MEVTDHIYHSTIISFKHFLFKNKTNRITLIIAVSVLLFQFIIFKYFYPYPSFIHWDSFVYIVSATENLDINSHMIGYSRFLRLFSVFSRSDLFLVTFQYFFVQLSILFGLFSLFYFYNPTKIIQRLLIGFFILNPLSLYLANLISSDCLFLSISFIWFGLLLWLINQPSNKIIVWLTLVLFFAFTIRYNALIYPPITILAYWLSNIKIRRKILGISTGILLCTFFVLHTSHEYKELTGIKQYSPFSGWQLANNAMYAYRFVDSAKRKPVPKKFEALDHSIRVYFDSTRDIMKFPAEGLLASTFYMWHRGLPLYKFRDLQFAGDTSSSDFKKWASMGPLYAEYGTHIIKQYPLEYAEYYLWPNAHKYLSPPLEYLEKYNMGTDTVASVAKDWFRLKSNKVTTRTKSLTYSLLQFYPVFSGIFIFSFFFSLLTFFLLKGHKIRNSYRKLVIVTGILCLLNSVFSIISTAGALRFLSFNILLMFIFTLLTIDWMWKRAMELNEEIKAKAGIEATGAIETVTKEWAN